MSGLQLLVEVLCEELPAGWGRPASEALARNIAGALEGIPSGPVRTWYTPRRIAVAVDGVAPSRPVSRRQITGPPVAAAWRDGAPTKAAQGFARAHGVAVEDLERVQTPRGEVIAVTVEEGGEPTRALLARELEACVLNVSFPRTMRWGSGRARWGRPIHSVLAVFGGKLVQAEVAGLLTMATTVGHRLTPGPIVVSDVDGWLSALADHHVMADPELRRATIVSHIEAVATSNGVTCDPPDELLDEVTDLLEWPVVLAGRLPEELMDLPPRLLVESMRVHQRIFDTRLPDGSLASLFLVASNNPLADPDVVAEGNARVLAARFQDARFFFGEDRKLTLHQHAERLERMQWVRGLGTMAEKTSRLQGLGPAVAPLVGADPDVVSRAAGLCKADLPTLMVGEFPELQGHVGKLYALHQGEPPEVAEAVEEHYLPRFAGDALPGSPAGQALALADRLDTLVGCFSVGLAPKGSADPQGLRRAANGVVAILRQHRILVPLPDLLSMAAGRFAPERAVPEQALHDLVGFVFARLKAQLMHEGVPTEVVEAVFAAGGEDVVRLASRGQALAGLLRHPEFDTLRVTFRRVMGLSKDHPDPIYDPELFQDPAEGEFHSALQVTAGEARRRMDDLDYPGALHAMAGLAAPLGLFFDQVLVMAEDESLRLNRLGLLRSAADLFRRVADFTRLSADGGGSDLNGSAPRPTGPGAHNSTKG